MPKVIIGAILYDSLDGKYQTSKYLPYFLKSIIEQDFKDFSLIFVDNSLASDNANTKYLRENFPQIEIISYGKNLGFGRAHNLIISRAVKLGADYFLVSNIDVIYEKTALRELVNVMETNQQAGSAMAKLKIWDFNNALASDGGKTNIIDSTGIVFTPAHYFYDRGRAEADNGQYDNRQNIFGGIGNGTLYRLKALTDVAYISENGRHQYFDELMFMYKEDIDLAYRLQLAGWECKFVPAAMAYHYRKIKGQGLNNLAIAKNRWNRPRIYKEWSFLNQQILQKKFFMGADFSCSVKIKTWFYQFKSIIYIIFFEPYLLKQFKKLRLMKSEIAKRREQIKIRINYKDLEKRMNKPR